MVEHVPELMTIVDVNNISLAAALVARKAYGCNNMDEEEWVVAGYLKSMEVLMALPTSKGAAFDAAVEEQCNWWVGFYRDERDQEQLRKLPAEVLLGNMRRTVDTHKQQAQAWQSRMFWITACVQLGLHSLLDADVDVAKKQRTCL